MKKEPEQEDESPVEKFAKNYFKKSPRKEKKPTSSTKKPKPNGGKSEQPSTASDAKLFEKAFAASERAREILITFKDDLANSSTTARISLPRAKTVMTVSTQILDGLTSKATSSSGLSRHNWGTEE